MTNINISAGTASMLARAESLADGEWLYLTNDINTVMNNKMLSLSLDINGALGENESIFLGHGYTEYASSYVELTDKHIKLHYYYGEANHRIKELEHGLTVTDFVNLTVDAGMGNAKITLGTSGGMYQVSEPWEGRNGKIYSKINGRSVNNVNLRWRCDGYGERIWLYGDSYFNMNSASRWPFYLKNDGYTRNFMSGYPGMNTQTALAQFKIDVTRGTPEYVVWCVGMNNADDGKNTVNAAWMSATEEFLGICREKGITPILSTIPSTPERFNYAKSEWVKDSGCRYIDFERAVGGRRCDESLIGKTYTYNGGVLINKTGNEWYENMLFADKVHPTELGAKALYTQVLVDFPEIMKKNCRKEGAC